MNPEPIRIRSTCRACGASHLRKVVPLVPVPIVSPNVGETEGGSAYAGKTAPLDVFLCEECGLFQLLHIVDPGLLYRHYLYRTAISKGLVEHFADECASILDRVSPAPGSLVVEFGSNDGSLLGMFRDRGFRVQGVDPASNIAAEASARGVPTLAAFFGVDVARRLREEHGPAKVIVSNNVLANIDDLADVLSGVHDLLDDDGVYVVETQYARDVIDGFLLDVIYHEHLSYFPVHTLVTAFPRYKLSVFDVERIAPKGGSLRIWLQRTDGPRPVTPRVQEMLEEEWKSGLYEAQNLDAFAGRVAATRSDLHRRLAEARASGRPVAAYGTSVGCAALIHQFELADKLDLLFDDTPFKPQITGPYYTLPVHPGAELADINPALVIILAWRYADMIAARHTAWLAGGGTFVVPLPHVTVRGAAE